MTAASSPAEPEAKDKVFVSAKTTFPAQPLPANAVRQPVTTERLLIRPFRPDDLQAIGILRSQEEVMMFTPAGRTDRDVAQTQAVLDRYLPPNDTASYNFAVVLRETGDLIGMAGCHDLRGHAGWPTVGYLFRKEYWGRGLATEFLRTFLAMWSDLPRAETTVKVDPRTVGADGVAEEQLFALIESSNARSLSVLNKAGFEYWTTWKTEDSREGFKGQPIDLLTYRYFPNRKSRGV